MISLVGRPPTGLFENTPTSHPAPQVPERTHRRPVSMAALLGEQMWKPEYQAVNRTPPFASASMLGVCVVGCPVTPKSPTPKSAKGHVSCHIAAAEPHAAVRSMAASRRTVCEEHENVRLGPGELSCAHATRHQLTEHQHRARCLVRHRLDAPASCW